MVNDIHARLKNRVGQQELRKALLRESLKGLQDVARQADTEAAIGAINRADVHYYLLKPWDPPQEKLYPVLDDLLEDWKMQDRLTSDDRIRIVGHRWSAPSHSDRNRRVVGHHPVSPIASELELWACCSE